MNELALFAGAGGGILGTHILGWRTVCAVEIEAYPREVLLRRQRDGLLPLFPIWDDIRTFDGRPWRGLVDVITGGFPCQPFSVAGKGLGIDDPRNMWPDTIRVIREVEPRYLLLENVPGLLAHKYFGTILGDLVASGFRVRWDCISSASVGAPHKRERLWIVGDSAGARCEGGAERSVCGEEIESMPCEGGQAMADADEAGRGEQRGGVTMGSEYAAVECRSAWWDQDPADEPQSRLGRVAHGVAYRVDRLKALGNGQVPAVVRRAWEELTRRRAES